MTIIAHRIASRTFAHTIWSGIGARDNGGRWNSIGIAVVYTAENRSLAALEQLVHLVKPRVLKDFVIASIEFDDSRLYRPATRSLPAGWDAPVAPATARALGDDWVTKGLYPVLAVPSVVIAGEWNYLFNSLHPEFPGLKKSAPEPFAFDDRLA